MFNSKQLVCTTCGYAGKPQRAVGGNGCIEIVLWLCFIIPGLIYTIWRSSSRHDVCPKCKGKSMIPADTPMGQKLIEQYQPVAPVAPEGAPSQPETSAQPMSIKKKAWVIGGIVIGFLVIVGMLDDATTVTPNVPAPAVVTLPEATKEEPLSYEIVKKIADSGTVFNVSVYTPEKDDDRIIQIADKIISENPRAAHIFVDFYNDKKVASEYNDKIFDEKISEKEQDELFTHYIANLKYNTMTSYKVLAKQVNGDWVELKKY